MNKCRKCQTYTAGAWHDIYMKCVKKGDVFRLFEPTGEPVSSNGITEFEALSDAFLTDGVWTVTTEGINPNSKQR